MVPGTAGSFASHDGFRIATSIARCPGEPGCVSPRTLFSANTECRSFCVTHSPVCVVNTVAERDEQRGTQRGQVQSFLIWT